MTVEDGTVTFSTAIIISRTMLAIVRVARRNKGRNDAAEAEEGLGADGVDLGLTVIACVESAPKTFPLVTGVRKESSVCGVDEPIYAMDCNVVHERHTLRGNRHAVLRPAHHHVGDGL